MDAIDYDVGANTRLILAVTGTGGQIQSLYLIADDNSNRIQTLETQAESISTNSGNNRIRLQHLEKVTTEQITQVNTQYTQLDNKVETLETQVEQLDLKSNILANGAQLLLNNMNDVLPRVLSLEQNTTTIFYKSAELPLSQYENGKMLTIFHPMSYDPLRFVMKARDIQTGFLYTVNPGSDYGFNYRHSTGFNTDQSRSIEIAIGSAGLFLMTNGGSRRNILTAQQRDRFSIYAVLEFVPSVTNLPQNEIWQSNPYADDSLNY